MTKIKSRKAIWIEELTWTEAAELLSSEIPVIVPIGSIAKEHGPHLPLNTDFLIAKHIVESIGEKVDILCAPIVGLGYYPAFVNYPGTISIEDDIFISTCLQILDQLIKSGADRIVILNTGISTTPELIKVVRRIYEKHDKTIGLVNIADLYHRVSKKLEMNDPLTHADMMETSMVLAIDPDLVKIEEIPKLAEKLNVYVPTVIDTPLALDPYNKTSPTYNPTGVLGDPTGASAALGQKVINAMVEEVVLDLN